MKRIKYAAFATILMTGCTSHNLNLPNYDTLLKQDAGQNGRACVRQQDINGFGFLDDDVVSISTRGNRDYFLATTMFRCNSLSANFAVGFQGTFTEVCGGGSGKIITADESCPIRSVFEFESRQAAFDAYNKAKLKRSEMREAEK